MPNDYTSGHCANKKQPGGCQLNNSQCWWPKCDRKPSGGHAVAAPLAEENTRLLWQVAGLEGRNEALAEMNQHQASVIDSLRADLAAKAGEVEALRAASVIEWEPGRSYTAAELLRRAIRGLRVRKGRSICPAVENLFGCGNTVARYLCRWAGRDPDTGQEIAARKGEGVAGA